MSDTKDALYCYGINVTAIAGAISFDKVTAHLRDRFGFNGADVSDMFACDAALVEMGIIGGIAGLMSGYDPLGRLRGMVSDEQYFLIYPPSLPWHLSEDDPRDEGAARELLLGCVMPFLRDGVVPCQIAEHCKEHCDIL